MKADLVITNPGKVTATISLTTTLENWDELKKQLKDAPYYGVASELRDAIKQLTIKVSSELSYYPETTDGN